MPRSFTLYEDEGTTYDYETGAYARTPMSWNEQERTFRVETREGSYEGMITERELLVRLISKDGVVEHTISYNGEAQEVKF